MSTHELALVDKARRDELQRALRLLRNGKDAAGVAEALARRLTNKLLHRRTVMLRQQSGAPS